MSDATVQSSSAASRLIVPDAGISLGLGLTNECNLACSFCYRDPTRADRLSLDQVKAVMERLPVRSVNLGNGENGMHPEFKAIAGSGWGRGDAVWACDSKRGNCADFHSPFIGVLRADGIPARFDIGFPLPENKNKERFLVITAGPSSTLTKAAGSP